ncbi:methyltransferase [Amycolatopsis keratiniphila]|uniref:Methyltransferase n=2 Tax=Amycolatopsis keratiniphila TaxID=129921 RepID=R4TBV8_9PSEU|nr:methyltransferase [Amycolatopsis keratiniphila]
MAASLVGVDNSAPMLQVFRRKGVPGNVTLVEADFRDPLPFRMSFDVAYSALGSFAYCATKEELVAALAGVADRVSPGSPLCFEYYSAETYRMLLRSGGFTISSSSGNPVSIELAQPSGGDVMTMRTTTSTEAGAVTLDENVLLLGPDELADGLRRAGWELSESHIQRGHPFDWFMARKKQ